MTIPNAPDANPAHVEFDCIDCGVHVFHLGPHTANDQHVCATCVWLRGIEDLAEREFLRDFFTNQTRR